MFRLRWQQDDYNTKLGLIITQEDNMGDNYRLVAKPLEFEDRSEGLVVEPTFAIDRRNKETFRQFIKDFIELGKELSLNLEQDFEGEKKALTAHLEDMRTLVFKKGRM